MPLADRLLALKLMLETDEEEFLRTAYRLPGQPESRGSEHLGRAGCGKTRPNFVCDYKT
jgi:hypothetical protein